MITTCKHYIMGDSERVWDIEREVLLERINYCVMLNDEYQRAFQRLVYIEIFFFEVLFYVKVN